MQKLEIENTLPSIFSAIKSGSTEYPVSALSIPGLRHFVYKSRALVQITLPVFEDPYDDDEERRRIMTIYQILHDTQSQDKKEG
jgi:hypothetical protein